MLTLRADRFQTFRGETDYTVDLEDGDCQLEYLVLSDGPVTVYLQLGETVLPIGVGTRCQGRFLVKDAKWLNFKPDKKTQVVSIQVFHHARRVIDANDGKPVAVHVPQLPPLDLRAYVDRKLGEHLEQTGRYLVERDEEYPDDIDEEFGLGDMQLEEDDEIEEQVRDAIAKRRKDAEARARGQEGRRGARQRDQGEDVEDLDGDEEEIEAAPARKKKPSRRPKRSVVEEDAG